jgi:hypothetical protein
VIGTRIHYALIFILAFILAVPLMVMPYSSTGVTLPDLVCIIGMVFFLKNMRTFPAAILFTIIILGIFSIMASIAFGNSNAIFQIGSLIFFIKPCFAYFAATSIIKSNQDLNYFFLNFKKIFSLVITLLTISIIFTYKGIFRLEGDLQADLLGLPVAGTYGTNSLASYLAFGGLMLLYPNKIKSPIAIFIKVAFFGTLALVLLTLSREAILFFLVTYLCLQLSLGNIKKFILIMILLTMSIIMMIYYESAIFEAKVNQVAVGLENMDLDHISSGRISLYQAALEGVYKNPLTGRSFLGFDGSESYLDQYDQLDGLSPHNSYLIGFWKAGIFFGLTYILFIAYTTRKALKSLAGLQKIWFTSFLVGFLLVLCNLWDVLLVPIIGPLYFFLCGAAVSARYISPAHVEPELITNTSKPIH